MLSTFNSGGKVSYRLFNFFPHSFQMILSSQSVILTSCSDSISVLLKLPLVCRLLAFFYCGMDT